MRIRKGILMAAALTVASAGAYAQTWPQAAPEAKAAARWWWLGSAINEQDLKWNMQEYAKAGLGALEITPLYGVQGNQQNELEFLSDPWMNILNKTQVEGKRNGVLIDMNNGTGWPFGGPLVSVDDAAAKLEINYIEVTGKELRSGVDINLKDAKEKKYAKLSRVMAYAMGQTVNLTAMTDNAGITKWNKADKKKTYRVIAAYCSRTRQMVKRAAPGGEGYVIDHFDRNAVANYLKRFEEAFARTGTPYPHSFFNDSYEVYKANWTPTMFEEFEKRRGYKLEDHLLELLGYVDDDNKTLSDYRETLGDMLLENFTEQWTNWAHKHGAKTRNQAHGSPANLIDIYSAVDIPEIEGFGLSEFGIKGLRTDPGFTRKNYSDVSMLKYASSAAHINGKRLTSSETFTWLTEHFRTSLSQCKPDLDLMFTCGVNNMYFHGTCFSPQNDPWPGWKFYASIDMSPTNSIWKDAPYLMKYIERSQSFLQMGNPDNDFIVYLPVRDMWKGRNGTGTGSLLMQFDIHSMEKKAPEFIKDILTIDRAGYDCDYISDKYLLSTQYKDGMLQTATGTRYRALIIPGSGNMPEALKKHIETLKAQGAKIIFGTFESEMAKAAKAEQMKTRLGLRAIRRQNTTGYHYFIANLTPNDVKDRVQLAVEAKDARWFNPLDGSIYKADIDNDGLMIDLKSGESMILQTYNNMMPEHNQTRNREVAAEKALDNKWTFAFSESAPKVNGTFNMDSPQTWEALNDTARITMGTGVYSTTVSMTKSEAASSWNIDLGDVRESARVYVNDKFVGCAWSVPFTLECGKAFKQGVNTIRIEVTNLPANRIADLDLKGVKWRKFNEINVVDINYKKTTYENWKPVKSGLASAVKLQKMK